MLVAHAGAGIESVAPALVKSGDDEDESASESVIAIEGDRRPLSTARLLVRLETTLLLALLLPLPPLPVLDGVERPLLSDRDASDPEPV